MRTPRGTPPTGRPGRHGGEAVTVVALLGLGEAGAAIAADLIDQEVPTRGWDPDPQATGRALVQPVASAAEAVAGSDVVLSLSAAGAALVALQSVLDVLGPGQVYADLNTAGAPLKRELAELVAPTGAAFADVALMAPVPGRGIRTPALACGPGAKALSERLRPLGMPLDVIGPLPGEAAARKLLRSVFMKGLAAACIEPLRGARALDCEPWMREQITDTLTHADGALLERLLSGSETHAARRVVELHDAAEQLRELGVRPRVAEAAGGWLRELRDRG